ncbi:MAG: TetR/AcrR family transcriptional regulator [Candidatus Dormibacteria bacterium]
MADVKPPPTYRQLQAQETRRRIAASARRLFAENGYSTTAIGAIAQDVGVAARTVYATFGTKKAILGAICQTWLEESLTIALIGEAVSEANPRRALELLAQASRQQWESGGDIVSMLQTAAATDGEIAAMLQEWGGDRQRAMSGVIRRIGGELRPGLDQKSAGAIIRALTHPGLYQSLVHDTGWSPDRFQRWLADTMIMQFLKE